MAIYRIVSWPPVCRPRFMGTYHFASRGTVLDTGFEPALLDFVAVTSFALPPPPHVVFILKILTLFLFFVKYVVITFITYVYMCVFGGIEVLA